jgi:rhodanese-related sulfurtransferase
MALSLVLAAAASLGWAQQGGASLPEPLRDMRRAGESCGRDDEGPARTQTARNAAAPGRPDASCAVPVAELRGALGSGAVTVVDARPAADYQLFHVPDALNLPARNVLHKPALKNKPLVLVGSGKGERELYAACSALRQAGFSSVRVLLGGMLSYVRAGLPLQGRTTGSYEMARLSAGELWEESQFADNLVLVSDKNSAFIDEVPTATVIAGVTPSALQGMLEQQRKASRKPVLSVVLAAQVAPDAYTALAAAIAPVPLLVYTDSAAALKSQLATQKAVWAAHARGPRKPRCG